MTTRSLLEKLNAQREALNAAIGLIESLLNGSEHKQKKASLLQSIKRFKRQKQVIRRQPWNKGKRGHKWSPEQRAKFLATMKKKYSKEK